MPMKTNEREYRDFTLEVETRDGIGEGDQQEERKVVRGYASTFDEPYVLMDSADFELLEQVDARAFDEADMSDVIFQYNHEGRVFARVKNGTLRVQPDDRGLAIEADLGGTDIGRDLYEEIKGGYTDKMSFGFRILEDEWVDNVDHETGKITTLRTIKRIGKVYDVSAVSIPANDGTSISVRSLSDGAIERIKAERMKALDLERRKLKTKMRLGGF
ncbi:MAG: HK97 family phage prohead protease [Lachnospiraceae bacterium]|nr:HK97 family phage prohead protease [Lachnospiraceae bacterium]